MFPFCFCFCLLAFLFPHSASPMFSISKRGIPPRTPSIKDIPGPKGKWFIGDIIEFEADPIAWMMRCKTEYGDIVKMDGETIVLHCPELIAKILNETNSDFMLDNSIVAGKKSEAARDENLKQWMQSRKDMAKGLNRKFLNQHIARADTFLSNEAEKMADQNLDLFKSCQHLLGIAIADFCLGSDPRFNEICQAVEAVFWSSLELIDSEESKLPWAPRPIAKKAKRLDNELLTLLTEVVGERIAKHQPGAPCHDVLDQLIDSDNNVSKEQLIRAIRLMMISAHGPSGATFSWTLLRLAENESLKDKVTQELSSSNMEMLAPGNFPLTFATLKEAMRLHPATWLMGRTAATDVMLGDYLIPEDTNIIFSPYVTHRDERFWQNPETFSVQRWLDSNKPYSNGAYYAFGAGPRVCPGTLLGPIQLILGLKALLTQYHLQLPSLNEVSSLRSTLLRPDGANIRWTRKST